MADDSYRTEVESWYKEHKFIHCSTKDANHWYEILDPNWDWIKFDYRIPPYDNSKSLDDVMVDNHSKLIDKDWKFT